MIKKRESREALPVGERVPILSGTDGLLAPLKVLFGFCSQELCGAAAKLV